MIKKEAPLRVPLFFAGRDSRFARELLTKTLVYDRIIKVYFKMG